MFQTKLLQAILDKISAVEQRAARIETRLMKLADAMEVNVKARTKEGAPCCPKK